MATKSILKNINIDKKHMGHSFMSALEIAQDKLGKEVIISKSCSFLTEFCKKSPNLLGGR